MSDRERDRQAELRADRMEGTLMQYEPAYSEHGRTPAQDERSGEHPGQAATSAAEESLRWHIAWDDSLRPGG